MNRGVLLVLMILIIPLLSSVANGAGTNVTTYYKVGIVKITFQNGNATIETPIGVLSSYYLEVSTQNTTGFISYSVSGPYWMSIPKLIPSLSVYPPTNLTFNGNNYGQYTANVTAHDQLTARAWTDVIDVVVTPLPQQPKLPRATSIGINFFTLLGVIASGVVVTGIIFYVYDGTRAEVRWSERWNR